MKSAFNIYPALFNLSPNQRDEWLGCDIDSISAKKASHDTKELKHSPGQPQTYYGNCMVGADQTHVTLHFMNNKTKCSQVLELTDAMLNALEIRTYKGKKYTISYIAVNN